MKQSSPGPFSVIFRHGSKKSCQIFSTANQPVIIHLRKLLQSVASQTHNRGVSEHPTLVKMWRINIFPVFKVFVPDPVRLLQRSVFFLCKAAENFQSTWMVRIIPEFSVIFHPHERKIFCITQDKCLLIFQQFSSVRIAGFTTKKMISSYECLCQFRILLSIFSKRGVQIPILKINLRKNFVSIQFTHQRKHAHSCIITRHNLQIAVGVLLYASWTWRTY